MLLASVALAAVVVAGLLVAVAWAALLAARAALADTEAAARRYRAWSSDREVFGQSRESVNKLTRRVLRRQAR